MYDRINRIEPAISQRNAHSCGAGHQNQSQFQHSTTNRRKVPDRSLFFIKKPGIRMAGNLQHFPGRPVRGRNQRGARPSIPCTMPGIAEPAGMTAHILMYRPVDQTGFKILPTFSLIEIVEVKQKQRFTTRMLTKCNKNLVFRQFQNLSLVDALIPQYPGAADRAEIIVISNGIQQQFPETDPGFSHIVGDRGMQHITIGKYILPYAIARILVQICLKRMIESGSNIRCVKNPNEAEAVLELINQRRDREVLSISDSGRAREYELTLTIEFRVTSTYDDFTYVEPTQLVAHRDITYSESEFLSREKEEEVLYRDMENDLIAQMIRYLEASRHP